MLPPLQPQEITRVSVMANKRSAVGKLEQGPGGGPNVRVGKQNIICVKSKRIRWGEGKGPGKG